jgi:LmbE family N-acetylglucosaminyl deacetylase
VTAQDLLAGSVAVVAPHVDDELLGCGATLAALSGRTEIHVIYATDGARSPAPPLPWPRVDTEALAAARRREAREALEILGVPATHAHFLALPDGRLRRHRRALRRLLEERLDELRPDHLLVPFRFDRHPDHLVVNRVARRLLHRRPVPGRFLEYFVYTRWRLLPRGDVRAYIDAEHLVDSGAGEVARALKRRALDACLSQTTCFYVWQDRPNLTPAFLDEACASPERFLQVGPDTGDAAIFPRGRGWIRVAHVVEPRLKGGKDRAAALLGTVARASGVRGERR